MKKRLTATLLSLCLLLTLLPAPVFAAGAAEGGTPSAQSTLTQQTEAGGDSMATPPDAQPETCTCETLCTEDNINRDCPVYGAEGADLTGCKGAALMPPATAPEAEGDSVYVGGVELTGSTDSPVYATTDATPGEVTVLGTAPTDDSWNIKWDGETLTLQNATITKAGTHNNESIAIYLASGNMNLVLVGGNTVDVSDSASAASCGIKLSGGSLTISGQENASLSVLGGPATNGSSYGIHASGTITIDSGTVNATGVEASGHSVGIFAGGAVTIENGTVNATSGKASGNSIGIHGGAATINGGNVIATAGDAEGSSYGIYTAAISSVITVNGGNVTATSGEAKGDSCGIFAESQQIASIYSSVAINGGSITAKGGDAVGSGWYSCGIKVDGTFTINGGTVIATAGDSVGDLDDKYSLGIFSYTDLTISGGDVTGIGGTGRLSSGIVCNKILTITGGTVVGKGGPLEGDNIQCSAGINGRGGEVKVSSATVTATGGAAGNGNSYGILAGTDGTSIFSVTINGNAVVRANTTGESTGSIGGTTTTQENSIVFENGVGTVYGNVTLQEDLTIGEGESLTLAESASLNANGHNVIVDGGTLDERLAESLGGSVIYKVTSVSLNKNNLTLDVGKSETLTATITPDNATNKGLLWTINNPDIIKFHDGATTNDSQIISAVSPGTATITVTTEDGNKTATCAVIVHTATTITTQPQSVSVTEGQSATFSVTATGDNLRYQWQINSGNGWSDITGATDASYTIDRTTTAMSGNQYCCVVTADGGTVTSDAATLTVRPYEPPYTGKYSYEIVSDVGENGTINVDRYATEGDQVTITVSPDEAYLLDDLTVTSGGRDVALTDNGDGTYTFTMPSGDVAITATFAEDPNWEEPDDPATDVSEIFTDVPANHWAKAAIQYAYDNGLMTGVSAMEFAPEATTTRAMIVSMLARMENVTSAADAGFTDVDTSDWYATAVNWAAANGIVNGISDDTFAPNTAITREQLAAMLMKYAQYKGLDTTARADLSHYSDQSSTWATEAVQWAVAEGLLAGVTDDQLQPQGQATRAQVAAIMQRFLEA